MIVHDMTERRRQRRRTERFVEESEDVILVTDADGEITYASGSAKRQFGHDPGALVGGNLFACLHPDEREPAMTAFFECVEGSGSDTAECRMASPDGGWFNVDIRYRNMLDDDAVDGMLVYLRNVTEARERARRFEGIFNRTLQFTALLEPDGTVVEVNDAALEFGGFDRSEIVGTAFSEVSWWTHSETVHDEVRDAIGRAGDGEFVRYKTEVRGGNGLATIDFSVKPVVDESGDVSELVAEGRNVTAREQHRRHLEVMQRVIRHNMRNDLTKLRGWAQLIAEEERADRRAERLETVERIVEKWATMAERMRDIHRLLQGRRTRRHTRECEAIVRDAVESVRPGTDDATIVVQAPSDVESVRVPASIRSAVRELVENAAASTEGATVEVELARPEEDWIEIRVRDDGPGLPEMEAEVLETGEETQLTHGLGLGLWTVRMVVTQAGGTASVESSTDGTEVRLRLPATHDGRMQPSIGMPE
jgi:PAS domain S-box-containing protein